MNKRRKERKRENDQPSLHFNHGVSAWKTCAFTKKNMVFFWFFNGIYKKKKKFATPGLTLLGKCFRHQRIMSAKFLAP